MDKRKSSKSKRQSSNKVNTNQAGYQTFSKDQKNSKNIVCEKDSSDSPTKKNKAHNRNKINLLEDIVSSGNKEEWSIVNRKKNNVSNKSVCEKQNLSKGQKQSRFSGIESIDGTLKHDIEYDRNITDSYEDTSTSIIDESERWSSKDKIKSQASKKSVCENKNLSKGQKQSRFSDIESIDGTLKHDIEYDRNITDSYEDTSTSIIDESERWSSKDKIKSQARKKSICENKNLSKGQKQSRFSDIESIDGTLKHDIEYDRNITDSYEDTSTSIIDESERWSSKDKIKSQARKKSICENKNLSKGQKQSRFSDIESIDGTLKHDIEYDRNITDSYEDTSTSIVDESESVLEEIDENIFKLSEEYSLAHCVAEDLRMGAGIAVDFKRMFGGIGELVDQKLKIGNVGIVKRHKRYVFYLVTKMYSSGKPTMSTMKKALFSLFNKMKELNLTKLGIPKIGCGLDRLDWPDIRSLIINIFSGSGIHITVCVPSKPLVIKPPPRFDVIITPKNLWEMEAETTIILFIDIKQVCKKNWTNDIVDKVDAKYPFKESLLKDIKNKKLKSGEIKCYIVKNEVIICMFVTQNEAYYSALENGFKSIDNKFKKYKYMAIQSGPIEPSNNFQLISWTVLILRSVIRSSELWLCGDVTQTNEVLYDQYCKNLHSSKNNSFQYNYPTQMNNSFQYNSPTKMNSSFQYNSPAKMNNSFQYNSPTQKNNKFNDGFPKFEHTRNK